MAEAIVIGAVLRVDLRGWKGAPPDLPQPPIKVEEARDGTQTFHYDICPDAFDMTAGELANRITSRLERLLLSEKSPFFEDVIARRFSLEIGLMYDKTSDRIATSWPPDFLGVLGDADVELAVTYYPVEAENTTRNEDDLL